MATLGDDVLHARRHEVSEHLAAEVLDARARRHAEHEVGSESAVAVPTLTGATVASATVRTVVELEEGRDVGVDDEAHAAAVTAVAAVGATEGLELLAVDRGAAVTTIATGDMEDHAIHEGRHA